MAALSGQCTSVRSLTTWPHTAAGGLNPSPPLTAPVAPPPPPQGFAFDYPGGGTWVKAFDRSGSSGNGAVVVVGDFRRLLTVSVFRSEGIDASAVQEGLTADSGCERRCILAGPQRDGQRGQGGAVP